MSIYYLRLEQNGGLGNALKIAVENCSNELIARMDTDDICKPNRFEILLNEFKNDDSLDICGSHIEEFEDNVENIVAKRTVPLTHNEIAKYQKLYIVIK